MNPVTNERSGQTLGWMALFASTGTLICCALPILLVSLGMGATVASLTSQLPMLVVLATHKAWIFAGSAALLGITAWMLFVRPQSCPSDPVLAEQCVRAQVWNRRVFFIALVIWSVGFTAAFLLLPLRIMLDL